MARPKKIKINKEIIEPTGKIEQKTEIKRNFYFNRNVGIYKKGEKVPGIFGKEKIEEFRKRGIVE